MNQSSDFVHPVQGMSKLCTALIVLPLGDWEPHRAARTPG